MSLTVKLAEDVNVDGAEATLSGLAAPAPRADIVEWLTMCAVLTAMPRDDDMTSDLKLRAFAERLSEHPGDIVRHVLKEWPESNKWFPTWSELRIEIDRMAGIRPAIIDRVRARLGGNAA